MGHFILQAKSLAKAFASGDKKLDVLKGLDLEVRKGDFIAITGPSGVGKSTLLHILGGLDSPDSGQVFIESRDIYKLSDAELSALRNGRIGFVFQFFHLLPEFTVLENVFMPSLISGKPVAQLKEKAASLLRAMGLGERLEHFPAQLSGGEKQRTAIARGLMNDPEILFCDEPTGNLDSGTAREIAGILEGINRERKTTLILVTHNLELASKAAKTYALKDGALY